MVAKFSPYVVQTIHFIQDCKYTPCYDIVIHLAMNISSKFIALAYFIIFGRKTTHCHIAQTGREAALPGYVTEKMLSQQFWLALCTIVTLRPGTSCPATGSKDR